MKTIDIRGEITNPDVIIINDGTGLEPSAHAISKDDCGFWIQNTVETDASQNLVYIENKTDAENLIKAIEKAIKLKWVK